MKLARAFRAWRYNPEKISDMSQVVAPPYDVIGPNKKAQLYEQSPYNVAWVDLPEAPEGQDKYQVAAEKLQQWKEQNVVIQDDQPAVYIYFQTYTLPDGQALTRKGFFATHRAQPFSEGKVRPHEKTFSGPKEDRFKLSQATGSYLSPIFGLYSDGQNQVGPQLEQLTQTAPLVEIKFSESETHRVWKIDDPTQVASLLAPLQEATVLIADGHHRYETAVRYAQWRQEQAGEAHRGDEDYNFVMMYFCALQDPGLVILPTHRVLSEAPNMEWEQLHAKVSQYAQVLTYSLDDVDEALQELEKRGKNAKVLAWVHDELVELLVFKEEALQKSAKLQSLPEALRDLDVSLLHTLIFEEILGISQEEQREYGKINYVKNVPDALKLTSQKKTFGFLMNATTMEQLENVANAGETMPQKSTFFYPKLLTGLTFYDLS